MHSVLINRLGGLSPPRNSVLSLTDRPDTFMPVGVSRGRKSTTIVMVIRLKTIIYQIRYTECQCKSELTYI